MVRLCGALVRLCAALALLLTPSAAADLVFRVPDVQYAASSKSAGALRANGTRNNVDQSSGREEKLRYEEYFVEHDISGVDAKKAARELDVESMPDTLPGCGSCSKWELEYCESRIMSDHCCCERRFLPEPFPWIPHTCYMGPRPCTLLARNCVHYTKIRDCCCHKVMAYRWHALLSQAPRALAVRESLAMVLVLLFVELL